MIYIIIICILLLLFLVPNYKETFTLKKWCLNCPSLHPKKRDMQYYISNNSEIPIWLKQESIYTNIPKPLIMSQKYNGLKNPDFKKEYNCGKKCIKIEFDLHKIKEIPNKKYVWVFYWSSRKRDYNKLIVPDPKTAFGDYENSGLVRSNEDGILKFKIHYPQPYQENGNMFPPHLQFCYKQLDNLWSDNIYTVFFFPEISISKFKKLKDNHLAIIINALPIDKGEIKNTLRIPYDNLETVNIYNKIKKILKKYHFRKIKRLIDDKRLSIKQLPIIIYCKNKECEASTILFNYLLNKGYFNLIKYPGGLDEWSKKYA